MRSRSAASGRPRAGGEREPVESDPRHELDELGVVAAAEPRRNLDHLGAAAADAERVRVGPSSIPSAATARLATSAAASACGDGQSWATGTPNAGTSARDALGDGDRNEDAFGGEPGHAELRPGDELLDSTGPPRVRARAASIAAASRDDRRTTMQFVRPARSVTFTTSGGGSSTSRMECASCQRGCGTPAAASASRWRSLLVTTSAVAAESGCGRPSFSAIRAAPATGRSEPARDQAAEPEGAPRAARSPCSSSVETMQRRSARANPGAAGSRSQTAVEMPSARAVSSTASCSGPAPSTSRQRSSSPTGLILSSAWDGPENG